MSLIDYQFVKLSQDIDLSSFDCTEIDINEFLLDDAWNYQVDRMANTYVFLDSENKVVAFFSISNDNLNDLGIEEKLANKIFNKFHRKAKIPNAKRIRSYPAIKIGRLGVCSHLHGTGFAYELMDFIKGFSILDLKPACRLLLLDAINKERQMKYYERNGFICLDESEQDTTKEKRVMWFNLAVFD